MEPLLLTSACMLSSHSFLSGMAHGLFSENYSSAIYMYFDWSCGYVTQIWPIRTLYILGHCDWLKDNSMIQTKSICDSEKQSWDTAWDILGTTAIWLWLENWV